MARTTMNEHCSAVILNKLPRKLGDPEKFLIPCEFPEMDECLALADLRASINHMPLSVWERLSLPELTPTCMTLELADRSVSKPIGIAKDVSFKVRVFHFPADFVVVDFEPDPQVPLILERCFLKTSRALIDVHKGKLTLCIGNEAITYNLDQIVRYSANYNQMTANKIDVIESACEEYSQKVLGFSNVTASGTPTPHNDLIIFATSPTLISFGDSDFLLFEEADAFLGLEDDPDSLKINPFYYDPEGDIILLEAILNSEPSPPLHNQEQNLPSFKEELKAYEDQTVKSFVDAPPVVELKDLPHHLEYAFLEGDNKLPVIIAKELGDEEKSALIKKMETELWNPTVKGNDLTAYTQRMESNPRDNCRQKPPFKRQNTSGQNVARAYTAGSNERKGYVGFLPYCNKCRLHHEELCTIRPGHFRKDCLKLRSQNRENQTRNKTGGNEDTVKAYAIGGGGTNP
uniref:Reverse transcriptase domain-containing protein n=1 Tax=Tanacetum cinerariifolium TaxID=118510 RepID=A0A699KWW7_TANCI|nr:reverse transcriptase domain-containing protein [Tanacetum cinerariifolium]